MHFLLFERLNYIFKSRWDKFLEPNLVPVLIQDISWEKSQHKKYKKKKKQSKALPATAKYIAMSHTGGHWLVYN